MEENKLFEVLLDVIPFAAYAVDVDTFEVVYANKLMTEKMHAPRETFCWNKVFGQEEVCSWCTIAKLKQKEIVYQNDKLVSTFFDEVSDSWLQSYDELVKWPDGRTVKYSIAVNITEQKEIQASMIRTHTKLALQTKKLKEANKRLDTVSKKGGLTEVNNRGIFFELIQKKFYQDIGDGILLFTAMLDLDGFKLLDDPHHSETVDMALKSFARIVESNIDKSDIFGRIDREGFVLVMISNNQEDVIKKLEKIRKDTQKMVIQAEKRNVRFTVSIGVAQKQLDDTLDLLLDRADQQLYAAKSDGGNSIKYRGLS